MGTLSKLIAIRGPVLQLGPRLEATPLPSLCPLPQSSQDWWTRAPASLPRQPTRLPASSVWPAWWQALPAPQGGCRQA